MPLASDMSQEHHSESRVSLQRDDEYRFRVRFNHGRVPDLQTDEPPPIGAGDGPSAKELLAAAVGHCLASSLLFCMQKARLEIRDLEVEVVVTTGRNEEGRLRIQRADVRLSPTVTPEVRQQMGRCLDAFEAFCTVTQSLRKGFPVGISLEPHEVSASPLEGAR